MNSIINKLMCVMLGHKHPDPEKNTPIVELTSALFKDKRHSILIMPCTRCISYQKSIIYTEEEFQKILKKEQEKYIKNIENYLKGMEKEFLEPISEEDNILNINTGKFYH